MIHGGANMAYDTSSIPDSWVDAIQQSEILLLQREVPEAINIMAATCAKENHDHSCIVVLDMGGRDDPISTDLIKLCDVISPN
jgi:sugar/nucleoside kinase (ribokinase family)